MSRNTPGSVIRVALVVAAALALLAQPLVAQDAGLGANMDPSQPLAAHVRAAFDAISPDPPPEETTRGSHYWISNELSHWVMRDRISNVGGVYIGVGTEQNYLLAGWARSAFLVLLDFDQSISDLHHAYAAFFMAAETPEEFLAYWDEDRIEEARALIAARVSPDQLEATMRALGHTLDRCGDRLRFLQTTYARNGVPSFVSDQAEYDVVRNLYVNDRVLIIRGDLTASSAMRGVAAVATANDMPVRIIYMSNAEQYFRYGGDFNLNMSSQPFDENSWIIHTRHFGGWGRLEGDDYHYLLQPAGHFVAWLEAGQREFMSMVRPSRTEQTEALTIMGNLPDEDD